MNVTKMKKKLAEYRSWRNFIQIWDSYSELGSKDLEITDIKNNILRILKYFKNTHLPNAYYKRAGGKSLIIPSNVR